MTHCAQFLSFSLLALPIILHIINFISSLTNEQASSTNPTNDTAYFLVQLVCYLVAVPSAIVLLRQPPPAELRLVRNGVHRSKTTKTIGFLVSRRPRLEGSIPRKEQDVELGLGEADIGQMRRIEPGVSDGRSSEFGEDAAPDHVKREREGEGHEPKWEARSLEAMETASRMMGTIMNMGE
ncbi:uncharacterized protein RSE6_09212 [Rhynchosporium secalis]|uniref:Uncharacterized protein n=1 Tax=Rhynchosporium secalis TaxID=38038 RepID=A0A1E1MHD0_RHYSE|nr:uncharacterized protein RSE6_09212 [Rhynchosporium secalis]